LSKVKNLSDKSLINIFVYIDDNLTRYPYMGSTATVALIFNDRFHRCNLGDSRTVAFDREGNLLFTTVDHIPEEEINRIVEAGGTVKPYATGEGPLRVNGVLMTSRAFGDYDQKKTHSLINGLRNYPVSNIPSVYEFPMTDVAYIV